MSEHADLARRSAAALGWSWAGALVRAVMQLLAQVALARWLGPEAFGQAAAVLLVIGLASLVAEWGLAAALIQRPQLGVDDPAIALGWVLLVGLSLALGVALLSAPLALYMGDAALQPLMLLAACLVPLQPLANLPSALLQRRLRHKQLQAIQLIAYALGYGVLGVACAMAGVGAASLLVAFGAHAVLMGVLSWRAVGTSGGMHWRPRLGAAGERAALLHYGARTTAANLVNWGVESVDRLLVSALQGPVALGVYSAAANLARAPVALLVGAAQPVAFAAASRLQDQTERLSRGYLAMLSLALLVAVPLFAWLAWHAGFLVRLLYGPAWAMAALPFAWLCLGVPFFVMLALTGPMLRGLDAVGSEMRAQAVVLLGLPLALWALSGQALAALAAVVSAATALRAAVLAAAYTRRAALAWFAPWRCWLGPLMLSVGTALSCAAVATLAWAEAAQAVASACVAIALALLAWRFAARVLAGQALVLALHNRRADSRLAQLLCQWGRLG